MQPDFDFYANEFGGKLSEEQFTAGLSGAKSKVDNLIFPNEVVGSNQTAYMRAICAAVDAYAQYGTTELTGSFRIGSFSMNKESGTKSIDNLVTDAIAAELTMACPSLLYKGIC